MYTMTHPNFIVCSFMENSIGLKREKEIQYFWEITTCDHWKYTMAYPDFTVCSFMENSIGQKRVNDPSAEKGLQYFFENYNL